MDKLSCIKIDQVVLKRIWVYSFDDEYLEHLRLHSFSVSLSQADVRFGYKMMAILQIGKDDLDQEMMTML